MNIKLSTQEFLLLQKLINNLTGIFIPIEKVFLIEHKLNKLLKDLGYKSFLELYYNLNKKPDNILQDKIIDLVTNNETMWFRDKTPWRVLKNLLLPQYLEEFDQGKRSNVRIWSAACSTGQEPYSTAICIDNYLSTIGRKAAHPIFEIIATDLSEAALDSAKKAVYDGISMERGLDQTQKQIYFQPKMGRWQLNEEIKQMVEFQTFNLLDPFWPLGNFDVILCRYVTIYFSDSVRTNVYKKLARALHPNGVLFLGNSEVFSNYNDSFCLGSHGEDSFYRNLNKGGTH